MRYASVALLFCLSTFVPLNTEPLSAQLITASLGENRQQILEPSAQITLPVLIDMTSADTLNLASLQLRVTWDTAVVGYTSWSAGSFGTLTGNTDAVAGGTFQANLLNSTGTTSSFTALNLTFDANASGSTVAVLEILAAGSESGSDILSRVIANSVSICINTTGLLGDVTGDNTVNVLDAQQIARWAIGLTVGSPNRVSSHGDVNGDGQVNIVDAQQIARWAVGLTVAYAIGDAIAAVTCTDALSVSTSSLPTAWTDNEYSQELSAAGADGTYSWSISSGTLPAGLSLVGSTISGTPTASGTSEFTVKVASGDGQTATRPLSIEVSTGMSITTTSLPSGIVDAIYATTLTATTGDGTYTWSITSGTLPDGLTLSADTISGTPTTAASNTEGSAYTDTLTSTFTVQVTSGDAQAATKELNISVFDPLVIDTTLLDPGNFRKGDPYERTVKARGGDGVYTWSVASGSLPPGLSLQKRNTSIWPEFAWVKGTPTSAGSFEVTLGVESGDGQSATKAVTITVTQIANTLTLSDTSLTFVSLADTTRLTATVKDQDGDTVSNATVTWASSDTTIATVSSTGLVTAIANGTTTITATSGSTSKTATVTVSQVTSSMTLSPTSLSFTSYADTATIATTAKDANDSTIVSPTVTWATSDAAIATVSSAGLVTSKGNGTATITATSGSVSETASVIIAQAASTVTLSTDSVSFSSFNDTATVTATVKDANDSTMAGATVTWSSTDTGVATVSSAGLVTSVADGTATITATSDSKTATTTVTIKRWASISAGEEYTCGVTMDNVGYCWGGNGIGNLGDSTTTDSTVPVLVSGGHSWKSISARRSFTCGVTTSGAGYCWGQNGTEYSQLGNGGGANTNYPVLVSGGYTWDEITVGDIHGCGETTSGDAYCWGRQHKGQRGDGVSMDNALTPTLVSGGHTWKSITTGYHHTCGLTTSDAAYCWGNNSSGELGDSTTTQRNTPVLVKNGYAWKSISAGNNSTCGITTGDVAYCWGSDGTGDLGNGSAGGSSSPSAVRGVKVSWGDENTTILAWDVISSGYTDGCGITTGDVAYCWGRNHNGQNGTGWGSQNISPSLVSGGHAWKSISAGEYHSCGVTTAGVTYCWGHSDDGRLGGAAGGNTASKITIPW